MSQRVYPGTQNTNSGQQSQPLDQTVLHEMNTRLGGDFSQVRVVSNSPTAQRFGAQAFTQGNEIHFAPGRYDPSSEPGRELLGHELTHVVQQRSDRVAPVADGLVVVDAGSQP